jgi:hypothetical protein
VGGGVGRDLAGGRVGLLFVTTIDFLAGGDDEFVDEDEGDPDDDPLLLGPAPGFGAIAIGTSTTLLYAGYPSHCLPDLTHFWH